MSGMNLRCGIVAFLTIGSAIAPSGNPAFAQIKPDRTLGTESSIINPNVNIGGKIGDRIDGGATRGANLFHSFEQFNVGNSQRVYFANPVGIENILSRVTGNQYSSILGTLGVLGNANLFLLNPNGIIFGQNASLDIRGSFVASTANSVVFNNGIQFSATNPQAPPLLTIKVPIGLQFNTPHPAAIVNAGNLAVGQNLTLVGGTVISTGHLLAPTGKITVAATDVGMNATTNIADKETSPTSVSSISDTNITQLLTDVAAGENLGLKVSSTGEVQLAGSNFKVEPGDVAVRSLAAETATLAANHNITLVESSLNTAGDLNLLAGDTVRVRDSIARPFLATAGGNLYIQGNKGIDILALDHPQTPFQSRGSMTLVSDGNISGDARFASGGSFSILNLLGQPGKFISFYDPIISSEGDVVIGDYTGVALKIEALGSITTGNITITGPDTTGHIPVTDSDFPTLTTQPALILRAGVPKLENPPIPPPPTPPTPPPSTNFSYSENFEGTVDPNKWSNTSTDTPPNGGGKFLGQFGKQSVSLTLDNLPPHDQVTVSFDLFIIGLWEGNYNYDLSCNCSPAPDLWNLSVDGRATPLFNTTFSNNDRQNYSSILLGIPAIESRLGLYQSYPNDYNLATTQGEKPARTGASQINSLGYRGTYELATNDPVPADSVYRLSNTFDHSNSSVKLNFSASGISNLIRNESWGLDNVTVSVPNNTPVPSPVKSHLPNFTSTNTPSDGSITATGNILTPGGPVIFSAASNINITGTVASQGGNISLNSGGAIDTTAATINSGSSINGGAIALVAKSDINTANISSNGGKIDIASTQGGINTTAGTINSGSVNGNGGAIDLSANSNITVREIQSGSVNGNGGNIKLTSNEGAINTTEGIINSGFGFGKGGDITFNASNNINISGTIINAGTNAAGDITLTSTNGGINTNQSVLNSGNFNNISSTVTNFAQNQGVPISLISSFGGSGDGGKVVFSAKGDITTNATLLNTSGGSSGAGGSVDLTSNAAISLQNSYGYSLTNSGIGGDFQIQARSLSLTNSSMVTRAGADGNSQGGNINVTSPDVTLNAFSSLGTQNRGANPTGNLTINTARLHVLGGSNISTGTDARFPTGKGGTLTVNASESVLVDGTDSRVLPSALFSGNTGAADGGDIVINTPQFIVQNGGAVAASNFGARNPNSRGGNITVNADTVKVSGTSDNQLIPSSVSVDTLGSGRAGNLTINARAIALQNGGVISASTFGSGLGGSIAANAKESVEISGTSADGQIKSGINAQSFGTGNAGSVTVRSDRLNIQNEARVTVSSDTQSEDTGNAINRVIAIVQSLKAADIISDTFPGIRRSSGSGDAGNITVEARNLFMNNKAQITAVSSSGEGGNINLQVRDLTLMRRNSLISATAGTAGAGGNGGNININNQFTIAIPEENSDITANAFQGRGGNINIKTQGIYGLRFRPRLTPQSDITVSSEFGVDGNVQIIVPDVDPTRALTNLSTQFNEAELARVCQPSVRQTSREYSEFIDTGRGGKPPSPGEPLSSNAGWVDLRTTSPSGNSSTGAIPAPTSPTKQIIEAQGWVKTADGKLLLTATPPTVTPYSSWATPSACNQKDKK